MNIFEEMVAYVLGDGKIELALHVCDGCDMCDCDCVDTSCDVDCDCDYN